MSKSFAAFIVVLFAMFGSMGYRSQEKLAQDKLSTVDKIRELVAAAEPDFSLKQTVRLEGGVFARWTSREGDARITIQEFSSPKDAYAEMQRAADLISIGRGNKVQNLGDEANTWENYGAETRTTIHFRKGNLLIFVNASSSEVGSRFAHHVVDQIQLDRFGKSVDSIN